MTRSRPPILVLLLALVVLAAVPTAAQAVNAQGEPAEQKHEAKQPNIFEPRLDLLIWSIIVFAVLLYVLKRLAWGPMLEGLRARENHIRGALEEAQSARDEAQRLRERFQAEVNQAQDKVRDILEQGRRDAQRQGDEMITKARGEIQTERDRMRREIEMARDQALHELWSQSAQLATLISAKAIRRELSPEDHRRLVDEALQEIGQKGAMRS